jgi:hypothetical protein
MANEKPSLSVGSQLQPQPKVIDNPPAPSVAQALANSKKQVDAAKYMHLERAHSVSTATKAVGGGQPPSRRLHIERPLASFARNKLFRNDQEKFRE